jgi:hypothetical protein
VSAGDGTHEEDDRHHHQARRHHGRRQADLALGVQEAAAGGHQDQEEGSEQLGEQPAPFKPRIVEVAPVAELERQEVTRARTEWHAANAQVVVLAVPVGELVSGVVRHVVARGRRSCSIADYRTDLNAARSSLENSSGSSHAAKWPPLSTLLK